MWIHVGHPMTIMFTDTLLHPLIGHQQVCGSSEASLHLSIRTRACCTGNLHGVAQCSLLFSASMCMNQTLSHQREELLHRLTEWLGGIRDGPCIMDWVWRAASGGSTSLERNRVSIK